MLERSLRPGSGSRTMCSSSSGVLLRRAWASEWQQVHLFYTMGEKRNKASKAWSSLLYIQEGVTHAPRPSKQKTHDRSDTIGFRWRKPAEIYIKSLISNRTIMWNKSNECLASKHSFLASFWRLKSNYFTIMNIRYKGNRVHGNISLKHWQVFLPFPIELKIEPGGNNNHLSQGE